PPVMNALISFYNLNFCYLAFAPNDLKKAIEGLKEINFLGANITTPFKESILPLCDSLDQSVEEIKAINTIWFDGEKLQGYNTDIDGISSALTEYIDQIGSYAVFGAGGAARALCVALKNKTGILVNRTEAKGKKLAKEFGLEYISLTDSLKIIPDIDLIVNATPVGMAGQTFSTIVPTSWIKKCTFVFDMVYNPSVTRLVEQATEYHKNVVSGVKMFLGQAAKAFSIWTRLETDLEIMRSIWREITN
ncbi:MAG: shikimate dehydrogenase, partial [Candidatus Hermodarchaeota archaeon]